MAILDSAIRTADTNSSLFTLGNSRWYLILDVTVITSTPSVTPKLELYDPTSGKYIAVWTASAAVTSVSTNCYFFDSSNDPVASIDNVLEITELAVGGQARIMMGHADLDEITYSVDILTVPNSI